MTDEKPKPRRELRKSIFKKPPIMTIYSPAGGGKTTFANTIPGAVFIQTEEGGGSLELTTLQDGVIKTYEEFQEIMRDAISILEEGNDEIRAIVIDTVNYLEPIVEEYMCRINDWESVQSHNNKSYGEATKTINEKWATLIDRFVEIRDKYMIPIVFLCHDQTKDSGDLTASQAYQKHTLSMGNKVRDLVSQKADIIGFLRRPVVVDEDTGRPVSAKLPALHLMPTASYDAKTRWKEHPAVMKNISDKTAFKDLMAPVWFYQQNPHLLEPMD